MLIKVKKLRDNAKLPTFGSSMAAGADLYACIDLPVTVLSGSNEKIGTGIAIEIPEGYFAAIFARSGLATKQHLRPSNCVGIIDSDYRGEVIVALHNDGNTIADHVIEDGDRIAQLIIMPYPKVAFEWVEELSDTERGEGGFGSTGTK